MRLSIEHTTRYDYSAPVFLEPHVIRLEPRSDPMQRVLDWSIQVQPEPMAKSHALDAEGNSVFHIWFSGLTDSLEVRASGVVDTLRDNPYDFLFLTPEASRAPASYSDDDRSGLTRFLEPPASSESLVAQWTRTALDASSGHVLDFLNAVNQRLYQQIRGVVRHEGPPHPPEQTLASDEAACRDVAVAFVACCRQAGLAARFVSGYQTGDPDTEHRHLHAWAEVYLPGGGWRGYDPTHGMAVADGHVALAAAPDPAATLPIDGAFRGTGASATLSTKLLLQML